MRDDAASVVGTRVKTGTEGMQMERDTLRRGGKQVAGPTHKSVMSVLLSSMYAEKKQRMMSTPKMTATVVSSADQTFPSLAR